MPCPTPIGERPTFIPVEDVARSVMKYTAYGQTIMNVFYFRRTGGYDATALDTLNAAITDAWETTIRQQLGAEITLDTITSTDQSAPGGAQDIDTVGAAGASEQASFESTGNTFAIKFGTGLSGRSNRGRMYWPLLLNPYASNGTITGTGAGNMRTAVQTFFEDILADSGDQHVVVSYANDCEWRDDGVANDVTSYVYVDQNMDSQRRRLPGRGI